MKIAIIGAGWLGCHLATKLKSQNDITLFDKSGIFAGSSFYNQNRLHKGFHYSRNKKTRQLCYDTFNRFINDYSFIVDDIKNNYYVIPQNKSLIDYGTFKSIFYHEEIPFIETKIDLLSNIEGSIIVDEKYINPVKAKNYFELQLEKNLIIREIKTENIKELSLEYDLIVNVTNNVLDSIQDYYYELSLTLIYDKLINNDFGSLTMVDGPLFSIYPYKNNKYTITDVQYTPMYMSENIKDLKNYKETINEVMIDNLRSKIEDKISFYYGGFKTHFRYDNYYTSVKVKRLSESADRYPTIVKNKNVVTCVTGKIQGIYILEDYIKNEIINR